MIKFFCIFLLACSPQLSAKSYGQLVTLSKKNVSLQEVFVDIFHQTGYYFFASAGLLNKAHKIDISVKDATVGEALQVCFRDQPLVYSIGDKTITITEKQPVAPYPAMVIRGKVVNENGDPLEGATIYVRDRNTSLLADLKGEFLLQGVSPSTTIIVSHVGYLSQEIQVGNKTFILLRLVPNNSKLDEIQIIAYGTTTRRLNTGDVSSVSSKEIGEQPVANPLEALEGRVTGLIVTQNSGTPGGSVSIQLMGKNSIANGNDPLYIIDGVQYSSTALNSNFSNAILNKGNPLDFINPSDIESIEVLKDADATSIYGSRGANGVILITTKKGKAGKTSFSLNTFTGIGKVGHLPDLLKTPDYLTMRREAFKNDGEQPDPNFDYDLTVWDTTSYTNWEKILIGGTSHVTISQASLSGGNAATQFLVSGGFRSETTVFPGSFGDKKGSALFNINHVSENKKFKCTFSGNYLADNNNLLSKDLTGYILTPPDAPRPYDSAGNINWGPPNGLFDNNPLSILLQKFNSSGNNLISNALLDYQMLTGLHIRATAGYNESTVKNISIFPQSAYGPDIRPYLPDQSFFSEYSIKSWILEPQLSYDRQLSIGKLNILAGTTFQQSTSQNQELQATGFSNESLLSNIGSATSVQVMNAGYAQYKYNAVFGRITYSWDQKYLINLTGRRDGSSRFGPGKQFANFGSAGLGWIFSNSDFVRNAFPGLSFGKLRASYGVSGNDQIPDYGYLNSYTSTPYPYNGNGGLLPSRLYNPAYSWETNRKTEAAVELGFIKDRVLFTAAWYQARSSNQLVGYPLPTLTGFSSVQGNLPATVENTSFEFELKTINYKSKNFNWSSSLNLTIPSNKLVSYPGLTNSAYANIYAVGKSLFIKQRFAYTGVDPKTGLYSYKDVDKDGTISYPNDLQAIKKVARTYYGGFQNNLRYRGFELDFLVQFVRQTGYNYLAGIASAPGTESNQPTTVMSRWQKPGDKSNIQQFTQDYGSAASASYNNAYSYGDNGISNASFIRLKNLSMSYRLGTVAVGKLKLQDLRFYVQGQNLVTITSYAGIDPENQSFYYLPPLRVETIGFQITF